MILTLALAMFPPSACDVGATMRALPPMVAGLRRRDDPHKPIDTPLEVYEGRTATDPLIVVAVGRIDPRTDLVTRRADARSQAISVGLRRTLFKGRFAVPGKPSATTFFGEYLTDRSLIQSWVVEDAGQRMLVSTTVLRLQDRRRMFDAVRRELLGGAQMIEETPVAPANAGTDR